MARRKKIGDVYRFDFDEKYHCYCQILNGNDVCFFDFYSDNENDDINEILNKNEIFRIWLDRDCFKSSKWKFICNKELFDSRKNITKKYNKPIGNDYYQIYEDLVLWKGILKFLHQQCCSLFRLKKAQIRQFLLSHSQMIKYLRQHHF